MKKTTYTILLFLLIQIPMSGFGQPHNPGYSISEYTQYLQSNYIAIISNSEPVGMGSIKEPELEHPLRRFEITFFISLPFIFIATFVSLHVYDVIKEKDPNVNVWRDYKPALLTGTFGISSAIALREALICMEINREKKREGLNEQTIYIYANKRY